MSEPHPGNIPGPVFVTVDCVWCAGCTSVAAAHFDDPEGDVVCVRQPVTPEEWAVCREAAELCPVGAIEVSPAPRGTDRDPAGSPP